MGRLIEKEWFRTLFLALLMIGVALALFGAIRYVAVSIEINQNPAYQIISQGQTVDPQSASQAQGLIASGEALRALSSQQNQSLILAGAGLVLIAVGWLGRDLISSRLKRRTGSQAP